MEIGMPDKNSYKSKCKKPTKKKKLISFFLLAYLYTYTGDIIDQVSKARFFPLVFD